MSCSTHIVQCLKDKNISADAFASSEYSTRPAKNGIDYTTSNDFCSLINGKSNWWAVDFHKIVAIDSYQITSPSSYNFISGWTLSVSFDNKSWELVDAPPYQFPGTKTFTLEKIAKGRFAKIIGGAPLCTTGDDRRVLAFYYVKFFGSINPAHTNKCIKTCVFKKTIDKSVALLIILLI